MEMEMEMGEIVRRVDLRLQRAEMAVAAKKTRESRAWKELRAHQVGAGVLLLEWGLHLEPLG